MSFDLNEKVAFTAPANACDAHFHVFGPADKYPYGSDSLRYAPPLAPLSEYLQLAKENSQWKTVVCSVGDKMLSPDEISHKVFAAIESRKSAQSTASLF